MVVQIASTALAQEAQPEDPLAIQRQDYRDKAARGLFEAGSVAFEEGRYEEALEHFEQAYELSPNRHLLLYNIASSLDRLRRDAEALAKFERYIELNPTASNRTAVEARVIVLRKAVEQKAQEDQKREEERKALEQQQQGAAQAQTQQPAPVAGPEDRPRRSVRRLPPFVTYVGAGLTAALLGVTIWSGLNTNKANDQYVEYTKNPRASFSDAKGLYDDGVKRQTRTNVLAATAGVVGVATGVVAIFFTDWQGDHKTQVQVNAGLKDFRVGLSHGF